MKMLITLYCRSLESRILRLEFGVDVPAPVQDYPLQLVQAGDGVDKTAVRGMQSRPPA